MKTNLAPAKSASSADWLARGFPGPPLLVSTFVPETFPAIVRVLNPLVGAAGRKLSWTAVAQELDLPLNGAAVGDRLCQNYRAKTGEKINVDFGTLDYQVASALAEVLSRHTTTPDKCFFAAWAGYSDIRDDLAGAPVVILPPEREMYLLEGPIEAATESVDEHHSRRSLRWWPADQTWCVGNDLYADSVYVAGSTECVSALVEDPVWKPS
ncbi:hypothetical protein [Arthrobacter rhizosphaerae]|uniref:hypothetical protein n=1 Tax=Arthrobacter rhizosphaerae TaxID=2855490 RepID=UPI001FF49995|nr:hypothetical protein [Arthrobacter rhizosphaerae]